jgi:hypothetical protein
MCARTHQGSMIAEMPVALWLLFVVFIIPFIDLTTVMLRYTFVVAASRDGVHAAAKAKSYMSDLTANDPSAMSLSDKFARRTAAAFTEIIINEVRTRIVVTNLSNGRVTVLEAPLTKPADTAENLYQIETAVTAQINPLIPFETGFFEGIPGLSAPMLATVCSRELCENPQGLNQ